ncbi:hypothetical protein DYL61_29435 [Pseudomonas nabeulensis]|uniref:Uncharacterized protein n=1 Tax=Pseudomonas nabeulensis TaxID=2293833 RepID=A0A4Z0AFK9_9PSED|nr:hypothetical protein [Pseudomonas nabeulensis]TFY85532.1 hypothetical protein DYL61_29435 [Pseudomonas nabeulensis]
MNIKEKQAVEVVRDLLCDVCLDSTRFEGGSLRYGVLQAHWGSGSAHDGERYEVHLCERCFFQAVANLKQERRIQTMFGENDNDRLTDDFGVVVTDDFFRDGGSFDRYTVNPGSNDKID